VHLSGLVSLWFWALMGLLFIVYRLGSSVFNLSSALGLPSSLLSHAGLPVGRESRRTQRRFTSSRFTSYRFTSSPFTSSPRHDSLHRPPCHFLMNLVEFFLLVEIVRK
jgi:hypothetical protein